MKRIMTVAAALLCGTLLADELNVGEQEEYALDHDMTVTSGSVAGKLILESGVTLTLPNNIFASSAVVEMRGARIIGFSAAADANVSLPNSFIIAPDSVNSIENTTDAYSQEGCNVTMTGAVTGPGTLNYVSTGRGFYFNGDYSGFSGVINLDISCKTPDWFVCESSGIQTTGEGSVWNFDTFPEGKAMSIRGNGGTIRLGNFCATATLSSYNGNNPAIATGSRPMDRTWAGKLVGNDVWTEWGTVNCRFDANLDKSEYDTGTLTVASTFSLPATGNATYQLDVRAGTLTLNADWSSHNVAALLGSTLSGNGTVGILKTWENSINICNPYGSTLKINGRQNGDSGVLTIAGEAIKRSGNPVLQVADASLFNVQLSSALAADGWKLNEESGVYSIYKNGLAIIIR